jgi:hypothetical protein
MPPLSAASRVRSDVHGRPVGAARGNRCARNPYSTPEIHMLASAETGHVITCTPNIASAGRAMVLASFEPA